MKIKHFLTSLFLLSFMTSFSQWTQIGQDIDGEEFLDHSGHSISISSDGSTLAIGAPSNSGNGIESGHVRVYQNINGDWIQIGQDIDGDALGDSSGWSVSLNSNGSKVAIGAPYNDGNGSNSGQVRVYYNNNGTWAQYGPDIDGEAPGDKSGYSVSISPENLTVAIGAIGNDENGSSSGHVRVYEWNSGWQQLGQDIDGDAIDDWLGRSVSLSLSGYQVAIGAPSNGSSGNESGYVRVYQYVNADWVQKGQDIHGEAADDHSGRSVSLSSNGNVVAIGAIYNNGNGLDSGHVRVYEYSSGGWLQIGQDIDGEASDDQSGTAVSLSSDGSIVAIGAWGNDGNGSSSGHVRVYQNINGTWTQKGQDVDGEAEGDNSGFAVSLSSGGSVVAIGSRINGGNGIESGHVRVYESPPLGVNDHLISEFSIYPNPVIDQLNISAKETITSITITNVLGQVLYNSTEDTLDISIDLSDYPTGTYIAKVTIGQNSVARKFIKE